LSIPNRVTSLLLKKEAGEEAGAPREGRVVEHQEDVGVHEVEVAGGGALEVTVAAEALEVVVAQVGSVVVVAVAEDSGEVVVVFEGHEIVSVYCT